MGNSQNYSLPKCRLHVYKSSLIPTVIGKWNSLPLHMREQKAHPCAKEGCSASHVHKKDLKNHIESKHKQMDCNIPAACAPTTHPTKAT
uniref:Uncharacterized protein n=1 Tax=Magallana gigas TaxID=29159 RepID=K1Q1Q3_MAGGI